MTLTIHALDVGTLRNYPTSAITYQRGFGEVHDVAMIIFVIMGGPHPIVVDTGTGDHDFTLEHHGFDLDRSPEQEPLVALAALGVDPADVRIVVNTHLHWDHCSNNHLFPNAQILVQRDELAYAIAPLEPNKTAFENTALVSPPWITSLNRMLPMDGDVTIADGVQLIHLPGHTPGSQGVLVSSGEKQFLLAGDCVDSYVNWCGDHKTSHIPSGSFTNLHDYWASFQRMERLGCEIIPSHDTRVLEIGTFSG